MNTVECSLFFFAITDLNYLLERADSDYSQYPMLDAMVEHLSILSFPKRKN